MLNTLDDRSEKRKKEKKNGKGVVSLSVLGQDKGSEEGVCTQRYVLCMCTAGTPQQLSGRDGRSCLYLPSATAFF